LSTRPEGIRGKMKYTEKQIKESLRTGRMTLTPEQLAQAFAEDYPWRAFDYGIQYFANGRFAIVAGLQPVGANLLHHALEMYLKGCLAKRDKAPEIRRYWKTYRHSLSRLWKELKRRFPNASLAEFDDAIAELDKFEVLRFPETISKSGAHIQTGFVDLVPPAGPSTNQPSQFNLCVPPIDRLVKRLYELAEFNPEASMHARNEHAVKYLELQNQTPLVPLKSESMHMDATRPAQGPA
jgi:hypothetical protein